MSTTVLPQHQDLWEVVHREYIWGLQHPDSTLTTFSTEELVKDLQLIYAAARMEPLARGLIHRLRVKYSAQRN